ncbi:MAG: SMC family ATPase [Candidatus Parvarchaeota archaeon]
MDIRFPDEGRIGILGDNESGKTTLLQAIEYALYGLRRGAGVVEDRQNLVTWGKNEAKLEIEFTSGQDTYVLQRVFGAKSGHRASLTPVIAGVKDKSNSITSLKDIEAKIGQITGMDRDSFTKLVYVKQKDLDALRELAKSKREQLVNKVMGIEVFDDASANVKGYISELEDKLEKKNLQLDSVRRNKEQYELKLRQKKDLEDSLGNLQQALEEKKKLLDEAKSLLAKYEWLYTFESANNVISSLKGQMDSVEKDIRQISSLEGQIEVYSTALSKYKPEVQQLQSLRERFLDLEKRLGDAESSVKSLEMNKQAIIKRSGLTGKDIDLLSQDLSVQKHRRLILFIVALVGGLGLLAAGSILTTALSVIGIALLGVAAYIFYNYLKIDRLLTANAEVNALTKQLKEDKEKASNLKTELEKMRAQTSFKSHEDIDNRLSKLSEAMKNKTGVDSVQGIAALQTNVDNNLRALRESKPSERKQKLQKQIQEKEIEIAKLQETKPASVDELQYDKEQHKAAKEGLEKLQYEYNNIEKEIRGNSGRIQQLSEDLEKLKRDYVSYPELEQEVQELKNELMLLNRVFLELSETSKELRNKVIPHARFIINQILPTLTDGRYSDFEITEDLKFKVHSNEAGGYKEREIFSGGTQDQFLIALRLAFTQSILDSRVMADKYSLLMDECISSSDDVRKQGIFEVLDVMKKTFSQIFVIAHEDISNFVDNHIVLARNEHGYTEIKSRSW